MTEIIFEYEFIGLLGTVVTHQHPWSLKASLPYWLEFLLRYELLLLLHGCAWVNWIILSELKFNI